MENSENIFSADSSLESQEIISLNKFVILSILSFGLYPFWWTYKAWRFFRDEHNLDIMPAARALFSYIFLYSLFNRILLFARNNGYTKSYHSILLHAVFVVVISLSYLPEPYFLISLLNFIIFIPAFQALNFAKMNDPRVAAIETTSFNKRQIVVLTLGSLLWLLNLWAIFANAFLS